MDLKIYNDLIPISYARKAQDAIKTKTKIVQNLLYHVSRSVKISIFS